MKLTKKIPKKATKKKAVAKKAVAKKAVAKKAVAKKPPKKKATTMNRTYLEQTPEPEDHGFNDLVETEEFFAALEAMQSDDDEFIPEPPDRQPNEVLSEIGQMLRPGLVAQKMPAAGEMWRNIQTQQVDTVLRVERDNQGTTVSVVHSGKTQDPSNFSLSYFRQNWEKYTPSDTGSNAPPQAGETWQNIHTGYKVTVNNIEQARMGLEVVTSRDGKTTRTDMPRFIANHRRIKGSSQWFVGALKLGK